jgi:hypothetical protein
MKGIFYEGKPLGELLDVLKDQETSLEFNKTVETVQKSIYKTPVPSKPKSYFPHSPVRKLTPQQIKKEYGMMQPRLLQEIITRLETDDLTGVEIRRAMGKEAKSSGHISGVLKRALKLCPELIEKKKGGKWSLITPKVSTVSFLEIYDSRKGKNLEPICLDTRTINVPKELPEVDLTKTLIKNLVEDFAKVKDLNINITVRVRFGFDKGE